MPGRPHIARLRSRAEYFVHHAWLPYLILLTAPLAGHLTALLTGLSTNPLLFDSGLMVGGGGTLIAGAPFADPNVGWTNQALGHLAAEQWLHGIIPWWNPYTGIGLPLAGEMQPAALFLPFVLLLIFQNGLLWLIWIMQALAGIACFALLRKLGLRRWTALIGGLLYLYSGTFAWVPGETILNVMPFLPVLLLGIEFAREPDRRATAIILVTIGIGWSLLGGFPETAYIDGFMALIWALARLPRTGNRLSYIGRITAGGLIGLLIASPAIVAFFDYAAQSNIFAAHQLGRSGVSWRAFGSVAMPYVFGPLNIDRGNLLLAAVGDATGGYLGAVMLPFVLAGLLSRRLVALQAAMGFWIILAIGKTFGITPVMAAMNALPLMKDVDFVRYSSPAWELAAIVLAMFGLEALCAGRAGWRLPLLTTAAILLLSVASVWPWSPAWHWHQPQLSIMVRWFLATLIFALAGLAAILLLRAMVPPSRQRYAFGVLLVINAYLLFSVPQLSGTRPGVLDHPALAFLRHHLGLGRFYTLGPFYPNDSAYFDLAGINNNYLPMADNWSRYIDTKLFPPAAADNGNIFWAPFPKMQMQASKNYLTDLIDNYRAIGVRYVITGNDATFDSETTTPPGLSNPTPRPLYPGQALVLTGLTPAAVARQGGIDHLGVDNATYRGSANGDLRLKLCTGGTCATGSGNLSRSIDDALLVVRLNRTLHMTAGTPFTLTITHVGGTRPNAIWLGSNKPAGAVLKGSAGTIIAGRTPQISFRSSRTGAGLTRVYRDRIMSIWHLAGARPYYTVMHGHCTLAAQTRRSVTARCDGPARLLRRELYMPGWHARVNGIETTVDPVNRLMQSVALPAGVSRVRFLFAPPFILYAWFACLLGIAALASEAIRSLRRYRKSP